MLVNRPHCSMSEDGKTFIFNSGGIQNKWTNAIDAVEWQIGMPEDLFECESEKE